MSDPKAAKRVLIADDDPGIRVLLEAICEDMNLETRAVTDGIDVVPTVKAWIPDLILTDAMMPSRDGFETTATLKAMPEFQRIPVIMLTGLKSREDRLKGIRAGADDFLTKPIDSEELILRVQNHLKIKEYADFLAHHNEILEHQVTERTQLIRESHIDTLYRLAVVSEYKDEDTGAHIRRISQYASEIARELGQSPAYCETIFHAASMHDIGKVGIPDSIMGKEGPLDEFEWRTMRTHTTLGARILAGATSEFLKMGEEIALSHHERWDGTGYPHGISGEKIPLSARIVTLADQYDALRSRRPYKEPFTHDRAMEIIMDGDGRTKPEHFDPEVHHAFRRSAQRLLAAYEDVDENALETSGAIRFGNAGATR